MTVYNFTSVVVWDNLGGTVKLARRQHIGATDPATGLVAAGLTQDGQPVTDLVTDTMGHVTFTATIPVVRLTSPNGLTQDVPSRDLWSAFVGGSVVFAASNEVSTTKAVRADDARLSDARTPTAHSHAQADVTGLTTALAGKVPTTRTVSTSTGLTGGGDLSANRTLAVDFAASEVSSTTKAVRADDARLKNLYLRGDLPTSTDINTYWAQTLTGIWAVPSTVVAGTLGLPQEVTINGLLEVESYASWTCVQRYYEAGGTGRVWHRSIRNPGANSWWPWVPLSAGTPTLSPDWLHVGDSLTDDVVLGANQWSRLLVAKTGRVHEQRGWYNQKTYEIAARTGATLYPVTVPSGSIPATGSVTVNAGRTDPLAFGGYAALKARQIPGTLAGRRGYLQNATDDPVAMTFTVTDKTNTATTVSTTVPQWFEADLSTYLNRYTTFWVGTNDRATSEPRHLVSLVAQMVRNLPRSGRCLVFGLLQDPNGTYTSQISAINAAYAAAFPGEYLDVNAYLISDQAEVDAAITYTVDDDADRAAGFPPRSLRSDSIHLNASGAKALCEFVFREAQTRGWA